MVFSVAAFLVNKGQNGISLKSLLSGIFHLIPFIQCYQLWIWNALYWVGDTEFSLLFLQVCDEVTEITCEIVPYTECEMSMEETPYKSFETITKQFQKKTCKEGMDVVQHTKMMPECRNVTKQNCITKWETDENGNQASDTFFSYLQRYPFSFLFFRKRVF